MLNKKSRGRPSVCHHYKATSQDLHRMLQSKDALQARPEKSDLPPQETPFLKGLPPVGAVYQPQQPTTQKLKRIIDTSYYADNFGEAIEIISKQRIPEISRIKTLDQFYFYVDTLVTWIPEIRVWQFDGDILHERTVYLRITQFYYYFNQRSLKALQSPIEPKQGEELSPVSLWLRDFAVEWGAFLDTPASAEFLKTFKFSPEYAWQDFEKEPQQYATFNEFFARTFKDINKQRPVASIDNDRVIAFPAESTFVGQWAVSTPVGKPLPADASVVVKHIEWAIGELLEDSKYGNEFEGGVFCHSFLNTYDYHRMHTSVAGKILEAKFIPGQVYLDVELDKQNPDATEDEVVSGDLANAIVPRRYLDAEDPTGYQFVQCRGLIVIETQSMGKVAILPIGMAQVSSVVFVTPEAEGQQPILLSEKEKQGLNYQQQVDQLNKKLAATLVGKDLSKGEMFSYFQFGGSDCVMVFERKANVNITAVTGTHYPIRSQYGVSNYND